MRTKNILSLIFSALFFCCTVFPAHSAETVIDTIVASVDSQPITLSELCARLNPPRNLSFAQAASDPEAHSILDALIQERVLRQEAESRNIKVTPRDIESYMEEVAQRNNLSREAFEQALRRQKISQSEYKIRVENEILKGRLASQMIMNGMTVSDQEVRDYIDQHPSLSGEGTRIKLRQILISAETRGKDMARGVIEEIETKLKEGEDFEKMARTFSDGAEAQDGGLLGIVAEKDLNPLVFDAVFNLDEDEISAITETPQGFHLFQVVERITGEKKQNEALEEQVREALKQRKLEVKMQTFFSDELLSRHAIDKKI